MSLSPKILALDLSTSVGFCFGSKDDAIPKWGVWLLPGPDRSFGYRLNAFQNCILDLFAFGPDKVYAEAPIPQRNNNVLAAEMTLGLHALLALLCFEHDLDLHRPTVGTVRGKVIGRAKLTPAERAQRLKIKPTIVAPWIRQMGWGIEHPDAADAAIVWAYAAGHRAPKPPKIKRAA